MNQPVVIPFTDFDDSKIFETENQKNQLKEKIKTYHPNLKEFKKIYSCAEDGFSLDIIREKCKNNAITFILIKSNFNKILGGYTQT